MKPISEIMSLTQFQKYASKESSVAQIDEEKTKKVLNRLFTRFERIFPKFWVNIKTQEHLNGIKDEWFECFIRSKITDIRLLQVGLLRAQDGKEEYLPKASTFIKWCTELDPEQMGFPASALAFNIAGKINQQFSDYIHPDQKVHLVIKHAVNQIGTKDFREMKQSLGLELFERAYEISCRQYMQGELKEISKGIKDKSSETDEISKQKFVVKEEFKGIKNRKSAMDSIRGMLR